MKLLFIRLAILPLGRVASSLTITISGGNDWIHVCPDLNHNQSSLDFNFKIDGGDLTASEPMPVRSR